MQKYKKVLIFTIMAVLIAGLAYWYNMKYIGAENSRVYHISFIYRKENSDDSQRSLKQGIEEAMNDYNIEVTFVYPNDPEDEEELVSLMNKEVNGGAEALILELPDCQDTREAMKAIANSIPVVLLNSKFEDLEYLASIEADNFSLGLDLAKEIADSNSEKNILLLHGNSRYFDIVEKYNGVIAGLKKFNTITYPYDSTESIDRNEKELLHLLRREDIDAIVAFDVLTLEMLGNIKKDNSQFSSISIYGFGKSNQIISFVEDEIIQAVGVINEYSLGYLGAQKAVNILKKMETDGQVGIGYSIINKDNIFYIENQRLLFPFFQ